MKSKKIALLAGLSGIVATVVVGVGLSAPSSAGESIKTLTASPNPSLAGQAVTTTPANEQSACPGDVVWLYYANESTGQSMEVRQVSLVAGDSSDDMWSDTLVFSQAGDYSVWGVCMFVGEAQVAAAAGFGGPQFWYDTLLLDVDAELTHSTDQPAPGQSATITPKAGGLCPGGTVSLSVVNPDETVTPLDPPTVGEDGSWTVTFTFPTPGSYIIRGVCTLPFPPNQENVGPAGHLAVAQAPSPPSFLYTNHSVVVVTPAAVSPAAAPPVEETPVAQAVEGLPRFVG